MKQATFKIRRFEKDCFYKQSSSLAEALSSVKSVEELHVKQEDETLRLSGDGKGPAFLEISGRYRATLSRLRSGLPRPPRSALHQHSLFYRALISGAPRSL